MLITRKTQVPTHWIFYAQVPFVLAIAANYMAGAPFLYAMKKFIDNPAAIMVLINLEVFVTLLGAPLVSWLSDRIWTRYGRRRPFILVSDIAKMAIIPLIPFAPDLWTLIGLKWLYGILADVAAPNQALTMEVVPTKQRGKGSGFFQTQMQIVNLVFWGTVIGRFDDVYFMGPLNHLFSLSGEHLMFFAAAMIFGAVAIYTFFGIKEIEPPVRKRIDDERKGKENFVKVFARGFFKDILSKSLLPLYMLLFVSQMTHVGLGILNPLLYTEQWGYDLQQMGTNIAIGAAISIPLAIAAGYFADATSKMKVFVAALIGGLLIKFIWVTYVYFKPDMRPELYEIIIFGEMGHIFGLIGGTVVYPLILEFVERNRLGTAGAGQNLFTQLMKLCITTFVGFWVVWWSMAFFPQAGNLVSVMFQGERTQQAVVREVAEEEKEEPGTLHYEPLHRPGVDGETSKHWKIRQKDEKSRELQKEKKELENEVSKWSTSLDSPWTDAEERAELKRKIKAGRDRIDAIEDELIARAEAFRAELEERLGRELYEDGDQILNAGLDDGKVTLALEMIEPVRETLTPEEPREGIFGKMINMIDAPDDLLADLNQAVEGFEYELAPEPATGGEENGDFDQQVGVSVLEDANGIRLEANWDPRYAKMNRAFFEADRSIREGHDTAAIVLSIFRGILGRGPEAFTFESVRYESGEIPVPKIDLNALLEESFLWFTRLAPNPKPMEAFERGSVDTGRLIIEGSLSEDVDAANLELVRSALSDDIHFRRVDMDVEGDQINLTLSLSDPLSEADPIENEAIRERLTELTGGDDYAVRNLKFLYDRVVEAAGAGPIFLTTARPVVEETYAERQYDYFFSSQFLAIMTDIFGLVMVGLVVLLEKKGVVHRYGVEEDAHR